MKCEDLAQIFKENNLTFFSGVPDSTFKDWMKFLSDGNGFTNIVAVNECGAAANCTGYNLATEKIGVVYMQNSGLGKIANPHTSLLSKDVYSIPAIYMIGWRGNPEEKPDEPQHKMMGRIMTDTLDVLEIPYQILPNNLEEAKAVISKAKETAETNQCPSAIIVKKGTLEEYVAKNKIETNFEMSREDAIKTIVDTFQGNEAVVSTTGKTSRELYECRIARGEEPKDFLTVGSMGCSASIGFGYAKEKPDKKVFVFDGDGAVLMQMGALATIGHYQPENFYHVVFDNKSYDSTGGQPTVSDTVNFEQVALACGYKGAKTVETSDSLKNTIKEMTSSKGPQMLIVNVNKGARKDLGRPKSTPVENKESFMKL